MTDRQAINRQNANSGPNLWSCPFDGCDFEGSTQHRWRHLLGHD